MTTAYLDDFQPLFVILGHFVRSDQLDVVAVARVAHDVVLRGTKHSNRGERWIQRRSRVSHRVNRNVHRDIVLLLNPPRAGTDCGPRRKDPGVTVPKCPTGSYGRRLSSPSCARDSMPAPPPACRGPHTSRGANINPGHPGTVGSSQLFQDSGVMRMSRF